MADTTQRMGHSVLRERLPNGLTVILIPKPGFQQVYAAFATQYGSIDREFRTAREPDFHTVPDGIAHFLEHKMFESQEGDVFSQFAKLGASANAFTTFDMTTYLFSSTEHAVENVETLLDFVQDPYFTEESVEKEKGIIAQEIRMYDDSPERRSFFELLRALYHSHPVRIEIAGTVESISHIDKDTLYLCYRTFYHPGNMVLAVVGGFDADQMLASIRENQARKSFPEPFAIERRFPDEPPSIAKPRSDVQLTVSQPYCLVGWKDEKAGLTGRELLRQELLTGVILDALFGRSSDLYHEWIDEGLIDQQFSWEYEITPSYGHSVVGGTMPDPEKWLERLNGALERVRAEGIPESAFERCRRKAIGRFITSLDSPGFIARNVIGYNFKQADLFDSIEVLEAVTADEANERLREHLAPERQAVSVVWPRS